MPQPLNLMKVRAHFRGEYQLSDEQAELMIQSSAKSIEKILGESKLLRAALGGEGSLPESQVSEVAKRFFHSLKGLFLNMGETDWADYARTLEADCTSTDLVTFDQGLAELTLGVAELVTYVKKG